MASSSTPITVVLPHRNDSRFLGEKLANLESQSRSAAEIIVVDDASSASERRRLHELIAHSPSVRLVESDEWLGVAGAVQRGLAEVKTEFVFITAADDLIATDFLERAEAALRSHPDAGFVFSEPSLFTSDPEQRRDFSLCLAEPGGAPRFIGPVAFERLLRRAAFTFSTNTIVYRTSALRAVGGFRPELSEHADWAAAHAIALGDGAVFDPDHLAYFRARADSHGRALTRDRTNKSELVRRVLNHVRRTSPQAYERLRRACILPEYSLEMLLFLAVDPVGRGHRRPRLLGRILVRWAWARVMPWVPDGLRRSVRRIFGSGLSAAIS